MPARLAYHWVKAHDPVRALPATIQAGLQSQAAYAFADAQQHFETALELWDQVPDAAEHATLSRARVLRHAAESAYTAGDPVRAIALTRAALAQVDPGDDPVQAGLLHGRLGGYLAATGGQGAMAEYEQAVALVPPAPPSAERAGVLAAFGEALMIQARYRDSRALCEEAIAIASQVDAPVEESHARRALGVDLAFLGDLEGGIEQLRAACRIAETVAKVDDLARALTSLAGRAGDLRSAGGGDHRRPGRRRRGRPPGTGPLARPIPGRQRGPLAARAGPLGPGGGDAATGGEPAGPGAGGHPRLHSHHLCPARPRPGTGRLRRRASGGGA